MTCPVCKADDDRVLHDFLLISRHEVKKLIDGRQFRYANMSLIQCKSCGVFRS